MKTRIQLLRDQINIKGFQAFNPLNLVESLQSNLTLPLKLDSDGQSKAPSAKNAASIVISTSNGFNSSEIFLHNRKCGGFSSRCLSGRCAVRLKRCNSQKIHSKNSLLNKCSNLDYYCSQHKKTEMRRIIGSMKYCGSVSNGVGALSSHECHIGHGDTRALNRQLLNLSPSLFRRIIINYHIHIPGSSFSLDPSGQKGMSKTVLNYENSRSSVVVGQVIENAPNVHEDCQTHPLVRDERHDVACIEQRCDRKLQQMLRRSLQYQRSRNWLSMLSTLQCYESRQETRTQLMRTLATVVDQSKKLDKFEENSGSDELLGTCNENGSMINAANVLKSGCSPNDNIANSCEASSSLPSSVHATCFMRTYWRLPDPLRSRVRLALSQYLQCLTGCDRLLLMPSHSRPHGHYAGGASDYNLSEVTAMALLKIVAKPYCNRWILDLNNTLYTSMDRSKATLDTGSIRNSHETCRRSSYNRKVGFHRPRPLIDLKFPLDNNIYDVYTAKITCPALQHPLICNTVSRNLLLQSALSNSDTSSLAQLLCYTCFLTPCGCSCAVTGGSSTLCPAWLQVQEVRMTSPDGGHQRTEPCYFLRSQDSFGASDGCRGLVEYALCAVVMLVLVVRLLCAAWSLASQCCDV